MVLAQVIQIQAGQAAAPIMLVEQVVEVGAEAEVDFQII
jgi:hypothetical protein